jgi:hypothetical protein
MTNAALLAAIHEQRILPLAIVLGGGFCATTLPREVGGTDFSDAASCSPSCCAQLRGPLDSPSSVRHRRGAAPLTHTFTLRSRCVRTPGCGSG